MQTTGDFKLDTSRI